MHSFSKHPFCQNYTINFDSIHILKLIPQPIYKNSFYAITPKPNPVDSNN